MPRAANPLSWSILPAAMLACILAAPVAADPHPFSVHDMLAMQRIAELRVSPDGANAVFTLRTTDLEANRGRTDLWLVPTAGGAPRQLTSHPDNDHGACWSPDSRTIFFLSSRGGSEQIWRIDLGGGEARQVTNLPLDVGGYVLSPDGRRLVVSMEVFPDLSKPDETARRLEEQGKKKSTGQLYDRLFFRHWDAWKDGRRAHLFALPVDGGDAIDLMRGMDADAPPKPFGDSSEFTFTPDGTGVVFAARNVGREEAWRTDIDLFLVPADGSAPPRCLTPDNGAYLSAPTFSPDGKTLAHLAMMRPGYEADRTRIVLRDWPTGQPRVLTEAWDRSPQRIVWSRDGKTIYTSADHLGQRPLFVVDAARGDVRMLVKEGSITDVGLGADRIVYALCHMRSPVELYTLAPAGGDSRPLTTINAARIAAARMGEPEQFTFKGWNDELVHGYVVKPAGFETGRKYPVAFLIHGGPQGSFGNDFHYRWNPQAYAGAGYGAVMIDFHGSTGYGQAFTDAINGHWGDRPLEDLKKGLDAALAKYSWLDGERVAALGASYGGYMINWIAGNWPDRFRCLVSHDGNLDERMAYYDTEELWFPEWEHGGTPWENPDGYTHHNPIDYVKNWKTPMLIVHGGRDYRVVDTQGLSAFTALQRKGIPSKLLYFADENHWVLRPANSVQWHETVIGWLDQWTKEGTKAQPPAGTK